MGLTVGLVGFGLSARVLQRPLIEGCGMRIAAVVTRQAEAVRQLLPAAQVLPDLPSLLALPQIDLVVIATPNHLHCPQALAALEHGKHVVVDKPLALTSGECERLLTAAATHGRQLAVFQNRRWDSDWLTLKRLLSEQRLGPVVAFEARWDRYRPTVPDRWRERAECGGGVLYDLGTHLIDQALNLFGWPQWLQAEVYAQRSGAVTDDAFQIRMGRGSLRITLAASSIAPDSALRYRVHGQKASFRKSGLDVQEQQLRAGLAVTDPHFGIEPHAQWGELIEGDSGQATPVPAERGDLPAFYHALRQSIEAGEPLPVPATQGRDVIALLEAARRSSAEGCRIEL